MATAQIRTLDAGIAADIAPFLATEGFTYDRRHRTFRKEARECTQLINFQVGTRSMEGLFAVNLGIYHPKYREDPDSVSPKVPEECHCLIRERLSVLRDTMLTSIFRSRLTRIETSLKWWLTTATDLWWTFSENSSETQRSLTAVLDLLRRKGLTWLDKNCGVEMLRELHEEQSQRVRKI